MKFENLSGGAAVGAAIAVFFTHGDATWGKEEVAVLAIGLGAAITYVVGAGERLVATIFNEGE